MYASAWSAFGLQCKCGLFEDGIANSSFMMHTHTTALCLWWCVYVGCAAADVLANASVVVGVFVAATIRVTS